MRGGVFVVGFAFFLGGCTWNRPDPISLEQTEVLAESALIPAQVSIVERSYPVMFTSSTRFPGFNFDTGFWPSGSPIQLRLVFRVNPPRARIELPGELVVKYPSWVKPGQRVSISAFFRGTANKGYLLDAFGFKFTTEAKLVIPDILTWQGSIPLVPQVDLDVTVDTRADNKPFTPFLLGRTFKASDSGSWTLGLKNFGIKELVEVTIGLTLGATVTDTLSGAGIYGTTSGQTLLVWNTEGQIRNINVTVPSGATSGKYNVPLNCVYTEILRHRYDLWAQFEARVVIIKTLEILNITSPKLSWNIPTSLLPELVDLPDPSQQLLIALNVDGTRPILSNLNISPRWLSRPGGTVKVCVTAADAHSGVQSVVGVVTAPGGKSWSVVFTRTSGSSASGIWCANVTVPANAGSTSQRYTVAITATDLVGNQTTSSASFEVRP